MRGTPEEVAAGLVNKWRRDFGVLGSEIVRADIAKAIREDRLGGVLEGVHDERPACEECILCPECAAAEYRKTVTDEDTAER